MTPAAAPAQEKRSSIQIKEDVSPGLETMIGMAPVRAGGLKKAASDLPAAPIPVQRAFLPEEFGPDTEASVPVVKRDTNTDDFDGSATIPRPVSAADALERTVRPPEEPLPISSPPNSSLPIPPGKVVAHAPFFGKDTDPSPAPPSSEKSQPLFEAAPGPQAAPLPPRPTIMETAAPKGSATLVATDLKAVSARSPDAKQPSPDKSAPRVAISDSLQTSIEEVHQGREPPDFVGQGQPKRSADLAIPLDAPMTPGQGVGTAQLVKSARDAPPEPSEPALPGQNLARVFGIFGGVLLLGAALLPVGFSPFAPSWGLFAAGNEAFLLVAWAVAGVAGIGGGAAPLLPRWRGLAFALAALPALALGTLFGLPLLVTLLGPSLGLGAATGAAPGTSAPAVIEIGALPILASVVPAWRVGFAILAWTLLPAGLFYRRFDSASMPARLVVTAGISVVLANYLIPLDGGFVATLLSPVIGGSESTAAILNTDHVSPFSLVVHLLGQTDELLLFFGVLLALPAAFALLSFSAFFPGEQVSRDAKGLYQVSTPALYTGLSGVWVAFYLLYLPIPLIALGLFLLTDPAQETSGLALIRFGLAGGALPLLFAIGCGQACASFTYRKNIE